MRSGQTRLNVKQFQSIEQKAILLFWGYSNGQCIRWPVVVVVFCHLRHEISRRLNEYKCDESNDWLMKCVIFCRDFSFVRSFVSFALSMRWCSITWKTKYHKQTHSGLHHDRVLAFQMERFHSKLSTVKIRLINCIHISKHANWKWHWHWHFCNGTK